MSAELYLNGEWLTTISPATLTTEKPVDFDRVFSMKADFSADVLAKIATKPGCVIEFGGARGTVDGVDEYGIIVRMKNSEFQKLRFDTK